MSRAACCCLGAAGQQGEAGGRELALDVHRQMQDLEQPWGRMARRQPSSLGFRGRGGAGRGTLRVPGQDWPRTAAGPWPSWLRSGGAEDKPPHQWQLLPGSPQGMASILEGAPGIA